jgi:hypothetical protein
MEEGRFSVQAGGLSPGSGKRGLEKPWFGSPGAVWRAAEGGLVSYAIAALVGLVRRGGGYLDHHHLLTPGAFAQGYLASPRSYDVHALRDLDAHEHLSKGVGSSTSQASQLQRRLGRPAQPAHRGVLADYDRKRLLLPP